MEDRHIILNSFTILDALNRINNIHEGPLVLFVVDSENKVIGSLTDGDIRRALIKFLELCWGMIFVYNANVIATVKYNNLNFT